MSKIFVTGASGFIGAYITHRLVEDKNEVIVLLRSKKLNWRLKSLEGKIQVLEGDLLNSYSLKKILQKANPEYIFHLAAYGSLPSEDSLQNFIEINIKGTANLIQTAKLTDCRLIVNTGSSSEYGIKNQPMKESDMISPINDYAISKAAATYYCQKEAIRNNVPIVTFRLFSVYGPYEEYARLLPTVVINAMKNKNILLSSPLHVRDYIYIEDVYQAYKSAIRSTKKIQGEIINIGSGNQYYTKDVVKMAMKITESKSKIHWNKIKKQNRQIESKRWQADIHKAKKLLGWKPSYTLQEGIKNMVAWMKDNQKFYE